ncbi:MAG: hypothetical protein M1828_000674 [Chrysothrix sp. TS-e1954]|nr:MAG: hypothetical protein M1828_000674 [Chrysothrix sp. TS-e1954]
MAAPNEKKRKASDDRPLGSGDALTNGSRAITVTYDQQLSFLLRSLLHTPAHTDFFIDILHGIVDVCELSGSQEDHETVEGLIEQFRGYRAQEDKIQSLKTALHEVLLEAETMRFSTKIQTKEDLARTIIVLLNAAEERIEAVGADARLKKIRPWMERYVLNNGDPLQSPSAIAPKGSIAPDQHRTLAKPLPQGQENVQQEKATLETSEEQPVTDVPKSDDKLAAGQTNEALQTQADATAGSQDEAQIVTKNGVRPPITIPLTSIEGSRNETTMGSSIIGAASPDKGLSSLIDKLDGTTSDTIIKGLADSTASDTAIKGLADSTASDTAIKGLADSTTNGTPAKAASTKPSTNGTNAANTPIAASPVQRQARSADHLSEDVSPALFYPRQPRERSDKLGCWFWNFHRQGCSKSADQCKYAHEPTQYVAARQPGGRPIPAPASPEPRDWHRSRSRDRSPPRRRSPSPAPASRTPIMESMWDLRGKPIRRGDKDEVVSAILESLKRRGYPESFKVDLGEGTDGDYALTGAAQGLKYKLGYALCGTGADAVTPFRATLALEKVLRPLVQANMNKFTDLPNEAFFRLHPTTV